MSENHVHDLAEMHGGEVRSMERLPDGSGCATIAFPLPANHWLTQPAGESRPGVFYDPPPMPWRCGTDGEMEFTVNNGGSRTKTGRLTRQGLMDLIRQAGRYAVRAATMNGTEPDFDPDAMVQNFVTGMLGYHTTDGLSELDEWANPQQEVTHG